MTTPMISRFLVTGDRAELQRLVSLAARWVFFPSIVLIGGLALLGQPLLHLFGADFVAGHWVLLILLVGQLVNVAYACAGSTLSMTGHQRTVAIVYGVIVLLNAVLCYVGARLFGLEGAAAATTISMTAWNLWLNALTRRRVGVDTSFLRALRDSRRSRLEHAQ
jgi:O-antigen/teichoic acid export membrane protein